MEASLPTHVIRSARSELDYLLLQQVSMEVDSISLSIGCLKVGGLGATPEAAVLLQGFDVLANLKALKASALP